MSFFRAFQNRTFGFISSDFFRTFGFFDFILLPIYPVRLQAKRLTPHVPKHPPIGSFGYQICAKQKELELTQKEFAEKIGVDTMSVYPWERNRSKPHKRRLVQMISIFGSFGVQV